jgi:hypothetical protein
MKDFRFSGFEAYAILAPDGRAILCGKARWQTWVLKGGERHSLIKRDRVGGWQITSQFLGCARAPDGPAYARFWSVEIWGPELSSPRVPSYQTFATREEMLEFHRKAAKQLRAEERLAGKKPELAQALLAELSVWCNAAHGRQSLVAKEVGTTPQTVNDWLNGRKQMTGEQALRIQALLKHRLRKREKPTRKPPS